MLSFLEVHPVIEIMCYRDNQIRRNAGTPPALRKFPGSKSRTKTSRRVIHHTSNPGIHIIQHVRHSHMGAGNMQHSSRPSLFSDHPGKVLSPNGNEPVANEPMQNHPLSAIDREEDGISIEGVGLRLYG